MTNLVGDLKCIMVLCKVHKRLLPAVGADECVDLCHINVVEILDRGLDLVLVGALVNNEHKRVVVLNLLHGRLCSWME